MSTVIDVLARRYLGPLDWPGHSASQANLDLWLFMWYSDYCTAALELAQLAQASVRDGSLVLRSPRSRAPLPSAGAWADRDLSRILVETKLLPDCPGWNVLSGPWPDSEGMPPGAVVPEDAEAWTVRTGVAGPGELLSLVGRAGQVVIPQMASMQAHAAAPEAWTQSSVRWTPERLGELAQYRAGHGTKAAAEHFGISAARVRQLLPATQQAMPTAHNPFGA